MRTTLHQDHVAGATRAALDALARQVSVTRFVASASTLMAAAFARG
jgi:hypothetical protein